MLLPEFVKLSHYVVDVVSYISGFVVKKVQKIVKCDICISALTSTEHTSRFFTRSYVFDEDAQGNHIISLVKIIIANYLKLRLHHKADSINDVRNNKRVRILKINFNEFLSIKYFIYLLRSYFGLKVAWIKSQKIKILLFVYKSESLQRGIAGILFIVRPPAAVIAQT
ncbi:Uncharacterized protein FWK35_00022586 [Aphis craccivora]|uniref:THAP-type domain-containing protein n=1 Tax=Aphis craccivora TaxID=307492 RepID=A0A6G0WY92_APHCR|nr:Uncharacterized protein FWK35_00022586 [Aphis craccivora]